MFRWLRGKIERIVLFRFFTPALFIIGFGLSIWEYGETFGLGDVLWGTGMFAWAFFYWLRKR